MTRMTPSEAFVETMVAHGVDTIFGIMGSAFMDAMDIFEPAGIELVPVVHEQGAAHMADGFSSCERTPRRGDRPERPGHLQLRHGHRGGVLGAQPGGDHHTRGRERWAWASAASRRPTSCRCSRSSPSIRATSTTSTAWPRSQVAASTGPCPSLAPPSSTFPVTGSTATSTSPSEALRPLDRGPGGNRTLERGRGTAGRLRSSR